MNKTEARIELEKLKQKKEELEAILAKPDFDPKKFLMDIFSDFKYKVDRKNYPDIAFFGFNKEDKYLFVYNEKDSLFWLSYDKIWKVLEKEMGWKYQQVQNFTKSVVEEHFKLKSVTTEKDYFYRIKFGLN